MLGKISSEAADVQPVYWPMAEYSLADSHAGYNKESTLLPMR